MSVVGAAILTSYDMDVVVRAAISTEIIIRMWYEPPLFLRKLLNIAKYKVYERGHPMPHPPPYFSNVCVEVMVRKRSMSYTNLQRFSLYDRKLHRRIAFIHKMAIAFKVVTS